MIRSLAWKEYREQRAVWLAMAALAVMAFVVVAGLPGPREVGRVADWKMTALFLVGLLIAGVYAVLCAAKMLAGERETGTACFLEGLAGWRTPLWTAKALTGLGLILAQAALVALALAWGGVRLAGRWPEWWAELRLLGAVALVSLEAFAWGMLLSAVSRTALGAVGATAGVLAALWALALLFADVTASGLSGAILFQAVPAAAALGASWWLYARADIDRKGLRADGPGPLPLLGQTVRQGRPLVLGLAAASVVLGCLLPWYAAVIWPAFTLLIGLLCGMAVLAPLPGGQQAGDGPFVRRWWVMRTAYWLTVALGLTVLLLVMAGFALPFKPWPGLRNTMYRVSDSAPTKLHEFLRAIAERRPSEDRFGLFWTREMLPLWVFYGFGVGMFLRLNLRTAARTLAVGLPLALALIALWLPSEAAGGLHLWQLYGLPILFVLLSGLLFRLWAAGRLRTWGAAAQLAACWLAAVLWTAGCLRYRVAEVPRVGEPFDMAAYLASTPRGEANRAGRLVEEAGQELPEWATTVRAEVGPLTKPPFREFPADEGSFPDVGETPSREIAPAGHYSYWSQLSLVLQRAWPGQGGPFGRWLERMCQGPWIRDLQEAAKLPAGVVSVSHPSPGKYFDHLRIYERASDLLRGRTLQLEHRGRRGAALDPIVMALALSRNLSHRAESWQFIQGRRVEGDALEALTRWALDPAPSASSLRRGLDELRRHLREAPPLSDAIKADYLWQMDRLDSYDPSSEMSRAYYERGARQRLLGWAMQLPWERARLRRIIDWVAAERLKGALNDPREISNPDKRYGSQLFGLVQSWGRATEDQGRSLALRRTELVLALVLYQAEHGGRPAQKLEDLVPTYLSEIPIDPVAEAPFGYFLSRGEELIQMGNWEVEPGHWEWGPRKVWVVPGRAVLTWDRGWLHRTNFLLLPPPPHP